MRGRAVTSLVAWTLLGGGSAAAAAPLDAQLALLPRIDRAAAAAGSGDPVGMQERYDAARVLIEALRGAVVPRSCKPLAASLGALAASEVALAEAFDRRRRWRQGEQRSRRARRAVRREAGRCRAGGGPRPRPRIRSLSLPGPGEAFFGKVEGRAPGSAARALITVNGARAGAARVVAGRFSARVRARPGAGLVEALFLDEDGARVGAAVSDDTWSLPALASLAARPTRVDRAVSARLAEIGRGFEGYAALRAEHLGSGAAAGWNDEARFPAASTVKLAVMIEAARRFGLRPGSPALYDVEQAAAWSSNLAANRLLELVGQGSVERGSDAVVRRLRALGARFSTYPGEYRAGTSSSGAPRQPPLATMRVTTARDLATILRQVHLAATGDRRAGGATGLRAPTARALLRTLLASEPTGDNVGLVRQALRPGTPVAQKHGWLDDARASATIVYGPTGPTILVVLAYRAGGLRLAEATQLGSRAAAVSLRGW